MAKNAKDEHLSFVIQQMLRQYGLNAGLDKVDIKILYKKIVGDFIFGHTKTIKLHKKTLYLHIDTPAIRQEIMMARSTLVNNINHEANRKIVEEIVIS